MPSAANRHAKAAKKKKKEHTAPTAVHCDSVMADISQVAIDTTEHTPHGTVDSANDDAPDASRRGDLTSSPHYISEVGKKTFQPMGALSEYWADQPIERYSVYNAADIGNPFHADWLNYQEAFRKKDNDDRPLSVHYTIIGELTADSRNHFHAEWLEYQDTFRNQNQAHELTFEPKPSSHTGPSVSKNSRANDCSYWPLGTCRNGDDCRFRHDPAKAPRPRVALSGRRR